MALAMLRTAKGRILASLTPSCFSSEDREEECLIAIPNRESVFSDLSARSDEGRLIHADEAIFVQFVGHIFRCVYPARMSGINWAVVLSRRMSPRSVVRSHCLA